jgi:hypothetical protein
MIGGSDGYSGAGGVSPPFTQDSSSAVRVVAWIAAVVARLVVRFIVRRYFLIVPSG